MSNTLNTYKAFYKGKTLNVRALTVLEAQTHAAQLLKAKEQWRVAVVLIAKGGVTVPVHPASL